MTTARTLKDPCPVCNNPIGYSGAGRKPTTCSTACRRRYRSEREADRQRRRRRGITRQDDLREQVRDPDADDHLIVQLDPPTPRSTVAERLGGLSVQPDFTDDWRGPREKRQRWRKNDAAAAWIEQTHPDLLDEWLTDLLAVD